MGAVEEGQEVTVEIEEIEDGIAAEAEVIAEIGIGVVNAEKMWRKGLSCRWTQLRMMS